jgi:hypothetical protein
MYCTERYAVAPNLTYTIPLDVGKYNVILYFTELFFTKANQRIFDVAIQGQIVLSKLDIYAQVGYRTPYISKAFTVAVSNLQQPIRIDLMNRIQNAKINGIEILTSSGGSGPKPVPVPVPVVSSPISPPTQRVKAPIRINCGGTIAWTDPISKVIWSPDTYVR